MFVDIHRRIGSAQQAVGGDAVFRIERDSDTRSASQYVPFNRERGIEAALKPLEFGPTLNSGALSLTLRTRNHH